MELYEKEFVVIPERFRRQYNTIALAGRQNGWKIDGIGRFHSEKWGRGYFIEFKRRSVFRIILFSQLRWHTYQSLLEELK